MIQCNEDLLDDQRIAASHHGTHARLLAGPGTGKTLTITCRILHLIREREIPPNQILAITFTRAAAFELRNRIAEMLDDQQTELPRVSTLHSFALRQLLINSRRIETVPQPLRIADDWEERNIILEDLKNILNYKIKTVRDRFNQLSADWQTLTVEEKKWENSFPDPRFLGAWRKHREIYSYTLRSELVYQLKRAIEQSDDFSLESNYQYLLVDEYQDLNRCDLAVIENIKDKGIEIFGAGDDDQSIYGFRYAHPEGIRRFDRDFVPSSSLTLNTCVRCDRRIINLALFVANLDPDRLEKPLEPRADAEQGEVNILRFRNELLEARGVALICRNLLNSDDYSPKDILILLRSDRNQLFSSLLREAVETQNVPVAIQIEGSPLDSSNGRMFLSYLRLLINNNDSLAIRTLLMLRNNRIGDAYFRSLYQFSVSQNLTFFESCQRVLTNPELIPKLGRRISNEIQEINTTIQQIRNQCENINEQLDSENIVATLTAIANEIINGDGDRNEIMQYVESIISETIILTIQDLLSTISSSLDDKEQEMDSESVNIMTMHKAKGLTAKAVIIVACEDEYIPGRQLEENQGDERRLLYVSLSRAKHFLAITYCEHRVNQQRHTGRNSGSTRRTLTRFLRDAPVRPLNGENFVNAMN